MWTKNPKTNRFIKCDQNKPGDVENLNFITWQSRIYSDDWQTEEVRFGND